MVGESYLLTALREQLLAQLANYDDDAFIALANRGLFRRALKDLETQMPSAVEETSDTLTMAFGDYRIHFDKRGPAHAQCDCPANGICQHILGAAISLQRLSSSPSSSTAPVNTEVDILMQLQVTLLSIKAPELIKHAGKAGYRWAWQFVEDLDIEQALKIGGDRHIVLSFSHPRISFRYMGGDLDSVIADIENSQVEKYRVAAILAYQRAKGIETTPPETTAKPRTASLALGKDHEAPENLSEASNESRERLRESVKQLFGESIELGLAHLSRGIYERCTTLAVWAQGAEYYRLALLLRRIADHIELLLERAGGADEHRLLDELALAFGLVSALDYAAASGSAPMHLVGRARTRYEETSTLDLLGLGASAWRSPSGYVGLTMVFWSIKDQVFLSCSDARPENQRGFDPVGRYNASGPWSGLGGPANATGRRVILVGAQINATGRLSASENTAATVAPLESPGQFTERLLPCKLWSEIMQLRSFSRFGLLAESQPMKDWVVLLPKRFGTAYFDGNRQTLIWPLFDDEDQRLDIELRYDEYTNHAILRIEALESEDLRHGTMLVARVRSGASGLVAEPLSLIRTLSNAAENTVDALYFDAPRTKGFASKWMNKIRRLGTPIETHTPSIANVTIFPSIFREYRYWLERLAERGIADDQSHQVYSEAREWSDRLAGAGLNAFSRILTKDKVERDSILQSHFICMQYERLMNDGKDD